jgi:hypothetical protein
VATGLFAFLPCPGVKLAAWRHAHFPDAGRYDSGNIIAIIGGLIRA